MIPSAKIAIRPSPPPENRFSRPKMPLPPRFFWIWLAAPSEDSRRRDVRAEPVQGQDRRREQDLLADLADPECPEDRGDH